MSEQSIAYEEVPGSRTTQQAVNQPQRERIAYEELQPGDIIQEGDEWRSECGRWQQFVLTQAKPYQVRDTLRVRRPYKITALQDKRDELRAEMDIIKGDRMNLREALAAEQRAHKVTMASGLQACSERDLARSEVARLSTELWARKPLEDRIASLTHELANAAVDGYNLQHERDETRAELQRLQEVVGNLYNEPTARQVQDMLRTWATELDWSGCCFDSAGRDKVSAVQRVLVAVIERIEGLINPEGGTDVE